jgi:hypothetical protein
MIKIIIIIMKSYQHSIIIIILNIIYQIFKASLLIGLYLNIYKSFFTFNK